MPSPLIGKKGGAGVACSPVVDLLRDPTKDGLECPGLDAQLLERRGVLRELVSWKNTGGGQLISEAGHEDALYTPRPWVLSQRARIVTALI